MGVAAITDAWIETVEAIQIGSELPSRSHYGLAVARDCQAQTAAKKHSATAAVLANRCD